MGTDKEIVLAGICRCQAEEFEHRAAAMKQTNTWLRLADEARFVEHLEHLACSFRNLEASHMLAAVGL
jgi:hypothetical protein